jgi:hypothetical protein
MSLNNHPRRLFLYVAEHLPSSSAVDPLVVDFEMSPKMSEGLPKRSGLAAAIWLLRTVIFAGSKTAQPPYPEALYRS